MLEVHGPHGATRVDATEGPGIGVRCLDTNLIILNLHSLMLEDDKQLGP